MELGPSGYTNHDGLTFESWMEKVDSIVMAKVDMSVYDLPDMEFMSAFEAECSPEEFFHEYVKEHLAEIGWIEDE